MGHKNRTFSSFEEASDSVGAAPSDAFGATSDNQGNTCDSHEIAPNRTTLDTIEKAELGIGLNGPFESLDEMLKALKDSNDECQKEG